MIQALIVAVSWLFGSGVFFHLWCRFHAVYLTAHTRMRNNERNPVTEYRDCVEGWYLRGWSEGNEPFYPMDIAMALAFFLWIPITLLWSVKHLILKTAKLCRRVYQSILPKPMRTEPPSLVRDAPHDKFMLAALKEVDSIVPESSNLPVVTGHIHRRGLK
jgi:hypothetical protein